MKLYDNAVSGNCYKVRALLSLLGLDYDAARVDLVAGEQKTPAHLGLNPVGKIPLLEDDGLVIYDSQAILVYLARRYGDDDWLPADAAGLAEVAQWLSFSANENWHGPAIARAIIRFGRDADLDTAQAAAEKALAILEGRLAGHHWLALDRPTIADITCYPYAALAGEGGVARAPCAALGAWFARLQALPGYVAMEGLGA